MHNLSSLTLSFWKPNWDRQSANWFDVPRMWCTEKLYRNVCIRILCSCSVAWFKLFNRIASNSFWSVSNMKCLAYRKWWNFSKANATAKDSNSIATFPFCASMRAVLAKYTGFPCCNRHAPSPLMLASICRIVSLLGLYYTRIDTLTISCFITLKASQCSNPIEWNFFFEQLSDWFWQFR